MSAPSPICMITVHGIGFQRPPEEGEPGYADGLHASLRRALGDLLGDDPNRPAGGPVYVQSSWGTPPAPEKGLVRLDQPHEPLLGRGRRAPRTLDVHRPAGGAVGIVPEKIPE